MIKSLRCYHSLYFQYSYRHHHLCRDDDKGEGARHLENKSLQKKLFVDTSVSKSKQQSPGTRLSRCRGPTCRKVWVRSPREPRLETNVYLMMVTILLVAFIINANIISSTILDISHLLDEDCHCARQLHLWPPFRSQHALLHFGPGWDQRCHGGHGDGQRPWCSRWCVVVYADHVCMFVFIWTVVLGYDRRPQRLIMVDHICVVTIIIAWLLLSSSFNQ